MLSDLSHHLLRYIRYDGKVVGTELALRSPASPYDRYANLHFALDVDAERERARVLLVRPLDCEECGGQGAGASEFCELALTVDCFQVLLERVEQRMGKWVMLPLEGMWFSTQVALS